MVTPLAGTLRRVMTFPSRDKAEEFIHDVAAPALLEVADELGGQGVEARVDQTTDAEGQPAVELHADVGADRAFLYRIQHRESPVPAYGGWAPRGHDVYSRLEVHLHDGGQGYDVMGYTHTQLIDDVLDQYERHLAFLRLQHDTSSG